MMSAAEVPGSGEVSLRCPHCAGDDGCGGAGVGGDHVGAVPAPVRLPEALHRVADAHARRRARRRASRPSTNIRAGNSVVAGGGRTPPGVGDRRRRVRNAHRLVDGREAVQFLVDIKSSIEDPRRLMLEV